jgi:GT2 family glycosyltransferase
MERRHITLSIVSHAQNALVNQLLEDVRLYCAERVELVITENIPDKVALTHTAIRNGTRKGFGANHNAAFTRCTTPYFCVCNPDIRLTSDPFEPLLDALRHPTVGVVGPLVRSPAGHIEDSARHFPTPRSLFRKLFAPTPQAEYRADSGAVDVDWIAGMFMLFRSEAFAAVGGFDERYFLYYEDVDLCRRLHTEGRRVVYEPRSAVVHDARRGSRRNPLLALQHAKSVVRFLLTS